MSAPTIASSFWQHWVSADAGHPALITPHRVYSWQELHQKVAQCAALFFRQGVRGGDVITLIGRNHPLSIFTYLAALQLGAKVALLGPQPWDKLSEKLNVLSGPGYQLWSIALESSEIADSDRQVLSSFATALAFDDMGDDDAPEAYHPDHLASLIFTSGSTGQPKAVAHTSRQHLYSAQGLAERFTFQPGDCWLLSLPLYHVSGLSILYRWLLAGATLKIGQGDLYQDIQGVSHASLVPVQLQRILDANISLSLTHVLLGGSEIPLALALRAQQQGIETWLGYGMTEAASTVTAKPVDDKNTTGPILPYRKLMVKNQRIFIGGHTLASGYFKHGQLTPLIDQDGWFDSKDLGDWVGDELSIIGRADNQFISGGENIHCEEIENVLLSHPDVLNVIVIPVNDAAYGARPIAVMATRRPMMSTELSQYLHGRLEKFKWPVAYYPMPDDIMAGGIKVSRVAVKDWVTQQGTFVAR